MKRLLPTSLALLLVLGSLGHVLAAAFCPRMLGHDCCLTKMANGQHGTQSHQHMQRMAMNTLAGKSMEMSGGAMGMTLEDPALPPPSLVDQVIQLSGSDESDSANRMEQPVGRCTHCMSHSGAQNAPVSSVSVSDQSNKDSGSVSLPGSRFLARPAMTLAHIGLPRQHAPPGSSGPRHILISVFLI